MYLGPEVTAVEGLLTGLELMLFQLLS